MNALVSVALLLGLTAPVPLRSNNAESQIKDVLRMQVEAWNRGEVPAFVAAYAPDSIFVGKEVASGRAQLLTRYERTYPTREAMGHLTFSHLEVRLLTAEVAIVTGEWHIDRSSTGGNGIGGLFSLVFQRRDKEWQIALDNTS